MPKTDSTGTRGCALIAAIQPQPRPARVAVSLDVEDGIRTIDIAPPDQVQSRLGAPIGPVKVERILADLPVVAHEPFIVDIGTVALPARCWRNRTGSR